MKTTFVMLNELKYRVKSNTLAELMVQEMITYYVVPEGITASNLAQYYCYVEKAIQSVYEIIEEHRDDPKVNTVECNDALDMIISHRDEYYTNRTPFHTIH